jgi:hypothetical protein
LEQIVRLQLLALKLRPAVVEVMDQQAVVALVDQEAVALLRKFFIEQ